MSLPARIIIDPDEEFPHLQHAPIIEAVIYWQANTSNLLEQSTLKQELSSRLPSYPICQPQHNIRIEASGTEDGSSEVIHQTQWNGFRLQDQHNHYVAQFTPRGVVFSRLEPYENWVNFLVETKKVWDVYQDLAQPITLDTLGVRYINRIPNISHQPISLYLTSKQPASTEFEEALVTESFFYQDKYNVPGYPYRINWARTTYPNPDQPDQVALILDIDVSMLEVIFPVWEEVTRRLAEMRWLKNKIFFNALTPDALGQFE
jgi:uncharacterized protein (TIGR04255 family)